MMQEKECQSNIYTHNMNRKLDATLTRLRASRTLTHMTFPLSEELVSATDRTTLRDFEVTTSFDEYSHYGVIPNNKLTLPRLTAFIASTGTIPASAGSADSVASSCIAASITRVVASVMAAFTRADARVDAAWVCVRVSMADATHKVPRWHTDGEYWDSRAFSTSSTSSTSQASPPLKFLMTFKGPDTRLANIPDKKRRVQFNDAGIRHQDDFMNEKHRRQQDAFVRRHGNVVRHVVGHLQGIITKVAHETESAIHSEPDSTSARIFVSVVPGTRAQIKSWHRRRVG